MDTLAYSYGYISLYNIYRLFSISQSLTLSAPRRSEQALPLYDGGPTQWIDDAERLAHSISYEDNMSYPPIVKKYFS